MSSKLKFQVGDVITKLNGRSSAEVESTPSWVSGPYRCRYISSGHAFNCYENEMKPAEQTEQSSPMKTLYSFPKEDGTVGYGNHIGTNSQNQYLVEEKTTGAILVFDKDKLEEVLPYTFSAKIGNAEIHYQGKPDTVKVGDILLYTGSNTPQIAVVTGVDTKNKGARAKFSGAKIVTEAI